MRLSSMNLRLIFPAALLIAASLSASSVSARAQLSNPPNTANNFKDTSLVKPPAGSKVAIYDFEDLECPACAHAFPIVHSAAEHYKIPIVRHDFPLSMHIWSLDAAITARYLQDKVSPGEAEQYRQAVFANQTSIDSKDALASFTQRFFAAHHISQPFVFDPQGQLSDEVKQDYQLGIKIGLTQTPTIFVATTKGWIQVTDVSKLYETIDSAIASTGGTATASATAHNNIRRPATAQH